MKQGFTRERCPKCGGNVYLTRDFDGWYEQCLQCSLVRYLDTVYENQKTYNVTATNREIDRAVSVTA